MTKIAWGPDSPGYPECPVAPGTDCTVWFRDGDVVRDTSPQGWTDWWNHEWLDHNSSDDIIAYEVHDAPDQARELLASIRDDVERAHDWEARCGFPGLALEIEQRLAHIDAYLKGAD